VARLDTRSTADRVRRNPDLVVWIFASLFALILLERQRAPSTFFFDEWTFVLGRRTGTLNDFLAPHNGHLSLLPVIVYKIAISVFGMNHYRPLRVAGLLVHVLVATAVYRYVRARMGPAAGVCFGVAVLLLGSGWQNIFWPFQVGFMGSALLGIVAWILIERNDRRSDVLAAIALGASLACGGLGIAVVIGAAARLAVGRDGERLLRIVAVPTGFYLVWYLSYGQSQGTSDNIRLLPKFVANEATSSTAALFGRGLTAGRILVVLLLVLAVGLAVHRRKLSPTITAPLVCVSANWVLVGYSRADLGDFAASRYVYVGAVFVLLAASDAIGALRHRAFVVLWPVLAALSIWGNWSVLHAGAGGLRESSSTTRSELRALEWIGSTVDPTFQPDTALMPQVNASQYLSAVREFGSPAYSDEQVAGTDELTREATDRVSIGGLRVAPVTGAAFRAGVLSPTIADGVRLTLAAGTCLLLTQPPTTTERKVEISFPAGSQYVIQPVSQPIDVRIRRYADLYSNIANNTILVGETDSLTIPADAAPVQTWIVDIRSQGDMKICDVSG
jgi:hypothetical protein